MPKFRTVAPQSPGRPLRGTARSAASGALRAVFRFAAALTGILATVAAATAFAADPSVAFYYGKDPPWDELAAFDRVVVEPGHVTLPVLRPGLSPPSEPDRLGRHTRLIAYVSVGELHPTREYFARLPAAWRLGANTAWGSIVVDQAQPEWPAWFVENAIAPLWKAGYRGFFLDTLDSFNIVAKTDAERARQADGLVRTVRAIKAAYPEARLIFNRGFEILPQVHELADAVAAESLYRGWNAAGNSYQEVPEGDRQWLLGQLNVIKDRYRKQVIAIDYVPPRERELARDTARRITALGFTPWVANPALDLLGVGAIEVMPRKILMLYDALPGNNRGSPVTLTYEPAHRLLAMPVNYLGYTVEYLEAGQPLPAHPLAGRYAGIVARFNADVVDARVPAFLQSAVEQGLKVAFVGSLGMPKGHALMGRLGLAAREPARPPARLEIEHRDPLMGFEVPPQPDRRSYFPLAAKDSRPLLRLKTERGETMEAAALTPWGGYVLRPYNLMPLPANRGERWVVDPIGFLKAALALPDMPVPDVTTENGRRLMMVHVDGDGFASRAELPGTPYAGEAMLRELLEKFRVPSTVSVIQGEVAANGLYPKDSPALEAIARRIFALPHVEIASHSFSHPFRWHQIESQNSTDPTETYNLSIPGYRFNIETEVDGSLKYINSRLAPAGRMARIFLWTGDCNPGEDSLEQTYKAGVFSMNGGETLITKAEPSLTLVSPIGIRKGRYWQIYAPNQNENVYTNLWSGPFYGYERAIETFELTDSPRRLKPIDIYYHTYSATKRASLTALERVYRWALDQRVMNIYASEYVARALDFLHMSVARTADGAWQVRGDGALRTLRLPAKAGIPDPTASVALAGHAEHNGERYLHLAADAATVRIAANAPAGPYLSDANARLESARVAPAALEMSFIPHLPLAFALGNARGCTVRADGRPLAALPTAPGQPPDTLRYETKQDARTAITVDCRR
jgi:hypothetical protein